MLIQQQHLTPQIVLHEDNEKSDGICTHSSIKSWGCHTV